MKILFITSALGIDYLSDCIFHGLVSSGYDVVDSKYLWYLSQPLIKEQQVKLYGKGFTLSGLLPDRSNVDRTNIQQRIEAKEFDCIIYGSIKRSIDYIDVVLKNYPRNKIVFCNGEDDTRVDNELINAGIYFKRELVAFNALPISFAIPEEKLCNNEVQKIKNIASIIPGRKETYIYDNEGDYYKGYQEALFGVTMKKAGWDCLRHYEIIANKCLPYFINYQSCPKTIMVNWPSDLQIEVNRMIESDNISNYDKLLEKFFQYCKDNLTTKKLADYMLSKVNL